MIFKIQAIAPAHLAACLEKGRHLAPNQVSEAMLDEHVMRLKNLQSWDDEALKPTQALAKLVQRNVTKLVMPEIQKRLANCSVFVIPLPYCGAYSESPETIVIGSGFLDYLTTYLYWGVLTHKIPAALSNVFDPQFPNTPVRDLIPVLLLGLLYQYLECGDPLPNYRALLTENIDEQVRHALAGALTFTLLHELGHLTLGHHGDSVDRVRMIDLPFQVPENLSTYKLQELVRAKPW